MPEVPGSTVLVQGGGPTVKRVFATRRRLVAAFSFVLLAFLLALVFQVFVLLRMEATVAAMEDNDELMQYALQLESEVREEYGHQVRYSAGDAAGLAEYQRARARALELGETLRARLDEPDAIRWIDQIREASAELDRAFQEQAAPIEGPQDPSSHDRSYPLVSLIEQNVDRIFARLQSSNATARKELAALEGAAIRLLGLLLLVIPAFVVAAVIYLSRSVAGPLARLSEGAAALAGGDLETTIDITTPDEFGALAAEFNAMTVAVRQHQRKLVEAEKLAAVGRLAAGVAHELNNPLQVMLGYLSLHRDSPDRRLAEQLAATETEALRCKAIVDGLLELSRPAVSSTAVDLRALCEDVAAGLRVSVQPSGLTLSVRGRALAFGDAGRIRQVIFNLMKNAEEAAGPGGTVEVRVGPRGNQAEVTVSDSGPGVTAEARARLFEPFFTTKPAGIGLGLAVSRGIALAHGGDIEVENRASGGATLRLRLPRPPGAAQSAG
jgi:two-component system NtrC family sensor kinase